MRGHYVLMHDGKRVFCFYLDHLHGDQDNIISDFRAHFEIHGNNLVEFVKVLGKYTGSHFFVLNLGQTRV